MFEKLSDCPSCKSQDLTNLIICKDHSISKEDFALVKCANCNLVFTSPRPDINNISLYYESEDYISHSNNSKTIVDLLYKTVRSYSLKTKLSLISQFGEDKNILDYGCGTGHFLSAALKSGWQINGVEPNEKARLQANEILNIEIKESVSQLESSENFSVITLWHVLEHIHDLNETFSQLKSCLSAKGKMIIAVPNMNSYDAQYYKDYWAGYDVPRHLYHFTKPSMKLFLKQHGMKLEKIVPMKFDSFYVSLLSEKYKHGSSNYIKSFSRGCKSNSYARKTGEYSSLIYIASKR